MKSLPEFMPPPADHLLREGLGDALRTLRLDQRLTLAEVAHRAGISPQYLSEVERGLKDPSSEMLAAIIGALGTTLARVLVLIVRALPTSDDDIAAAEAPHRVRRLSPLASRRLTSAPEPDWSQAPGWSQTVTLSAA